MSRPVSKPVKRLLIVLASVVILVLGAHLGGVALMRHYTEQLLHPPLPHGTQIGEIHLNLFMGTLEVRDFELRNDEQLRMKLGLLTLKISPWRLLTGEVYVQNAQLSDGFVRVDRRQDGSYDLGIPPFGDAQEEPAESQPLDLRIAKAGMEGIDLEYHDGGFRALARLEHVAMGAYSLRAATQEVPLDWQLFLDEREVTGQATLSLDQGQLGAEGKIKTALLDLGTVQRLGALDPLVEGKVAFDGGFSWQAPQLSLRGSLQAPSLVYTVGDRLVSISDGDLPEFEFKLTTAPELAAELTPAEGTGVGAIEWKTPKQRASAAGLRISGRFRYEDNQLVNVSGLKFRAGGFDWQEGTQKARLADFAIDGAMQQGIAGELHLPSADLQLSAARIEFEEEQGNLTAGLDGFRLEGLTLRPVKGGEAGSRELSGRLSAATSRVGQADSVLHWSALTAALGGVLDMKQASVSSDLTVNELKIENPALANGPLQIEKITTAKLVIGTESRFERIEISGIQLPGDLPETGVKIGMLGFSGGSFDDAQGLDLGDIVIDGLQTAVIRDAKGQWRHPGTAIRPQESTPDTQIEAAPAEGEGIAWRVGSLKVTGESYLVTGDRTNPAATPLRNRIEVLSIGELASARPNQDTPFELAVQPDKYTRFSVTGVGRPVADPLYLELKGELQGLGMPRLNGFIANDLGHKFLAGQLDARFDVKVADNHLKMGNSLELHGAEAEEIEGKSGPPLTTAIALLEDRDGYVKIDVPIEGQLDDPNFRVLAALNPVIMKAVAGTAALAIQPLGSVLLVGGLLADKALKVTFNPTLFDPGDTTLNPAAEKYLGELSGKLKEKPKLALRVCGVVVDAERQRDKKGAYLDKEEELLALAQQRADAVRAFMKGAGVAKKQLRSCRPKLDAKPEAKPRVEIRL